MISTIVHTTHHARSGAILGCAGYTGQETLDRLLAHPGLEPIALGSDSLAGRPPGALDPRLDGDLPAFVSNAEAAASGRRRALSLHRPRGRGGVRGARGAVVVDLSAAHRLRDAEASPRLVRHAPGAWSYGLPELYPPEGRLIANPGCYATAALLALGPLADGLDTAIVDAKSGVSGAGRTLRHSSHAGAVLENLAPYAVGEHRHAPEIAEQLGFDICFVPHLLPVRRGLLATCYVRVRRRRTRGDRGRVRIEPDRPGASRGRRAELGRVQGTDAAEVAVFTDRTTDTTIVRLRDRQPR